jgi:regulator of protease activity HflC (stomatin/prohibitin superfamily)
LLDWLARVLDTALSVVPRLVIVRSTHSLVTFRHGRHLRVRGPGLHVYWPLVTSVQQMYTIASPALAVGRTADIDDTIGDIACVSVAELLATHTLEEVLDRNASGELSVELSDRAAERLKPFGVDLEFACLTDLAPCDVLKHFGLSLTANAPKVPKDG